jgi:hypothetical protein
MTLSMLKLNEPVITALVKILEEGLPGTIESLNESLTDAFTLDEPVEILPYMPIGSTLTNGMPIVYIQDLPSRFSNDLQTSMEGTHGIAVATVLQTADHQTLAWQLRRYTQAIAYTIQKDRELGVLSLMRKEAQVLYTEFAGTQPGPLLSDRNPDSAGEPPSSYLSWTGLLLECRRQEVGG